MEKTMKRRLAHTLLFTLVSSLLFPPMVSGGWEGYRWPIYRGDRALNGVAEGSIPDSLQLLWTVETGDEIRSSPVIDRDSVYIGSTDGKVYALRLRDGKKRWDFDTGNAVEAPPLLLGGRVYVGSLDGMLFAIDGRSGTPRWSREVGNRIVGSATWVTAPGGKGTRILVGSYDSILYCFEGDTGKPVWQYATENFINCTPSIYGGDAGQAVFGGCDGNVHLVSVVRGSAIRKIPIGSYIAGSAALYGGFAYLGHYGNRLISVDLEKGRVQWEYGDDEGGAFFSSPAVTETRVIAGSKDWKVHCVDRKSGAGLWTFTTGGEVDSSPVICGEMVVVGSADGSLYMLSLEDGKEIWSYEIGEAILSSPAVAQGMVVIGADDGIVYGFGK
jgi:outer membrane protein assembly factor BamB